MYTKHQRRHTRIQDKKKATMSPSPGYRVKPQGFIRSSITRYDDILVKSTRLSPHLVIVQVNYIQVSGTPLVSMSRALTLKLSSSSILHFSIRVEPVELEASR